MTIINAVTTRLKAHSATTVYDPGDLVKLANGAIFKRNGTTPDARAWAVGWHDGEWSDITSDPIIGQSCFISHGSTSSAGTSVYGLSMTPEYVQPADWTLTYDAVNTRLLFSHVGIYQVEATAGLYAGSTSTHQALNITSALNCGVKMIQDGRIRTVTNTAHESSSASPGIAIITITARDGGAIFNSVMSSGGTRHQSRTHFKATRIG